MREIKFRAWDGGEMVFSQHPKLTKSVRIKFGEVSLVEKYFNEASGQDAEMRINAEIMQYTGLKDKNGTEIYEGDIVRQYKDYGEKNLDQVAAVECESVTEWWWGRHGTISDALTYHNDTEIIGNIYENPELLEVESE